MNNNNNVSMDVLINSLSTYFHEMFGGLAEKLNANLIIVEEKDGGVVAPIVAQQTPSITVEHSLSTEPFSLKEASPIKIVEDKIPLKQVVARVLVKYDDACTAHENSTFRRVLFGKIFSLGKAQIASGRGWGYDQIQYGTTAFSFYRPNSTVFREDSNGNLEIRFYSNSTI